MLRLKNAFLLFLGLLGLEMISIFLAMQVGLIFLAPFIIILSLTVAVLFVSTAWSVFFGAPFVPTDKRNVDDMIRLADIKEGDHMVDLGAGDGRIVIAAAKAGAFAEGWEISPFLWLLSKWNIRREGLEGKAVVHLGSYWPENMKDVNVVTLFLIDLQMGRMKKKLQAELAPGARVVSYAFRFPDWEYKEKSGRGVYLYIR